MLGLSAVGCQQVGGSELRFAWCKIGSYCQPMNTIKSFFAKISQKLFAQHIHQEIEHRILPQLVGDKNCGYPFNDSEEKLEEFAAFGGLDAQLHLDMIERRAKELPDTYANAFRYLMYRDLNTRMKMYLEFVQKRTPSKATPVASRPQPAT